VKFWGRIQDLIYNSRTGTVALTILLIIIGMIASAVVNYISVSPVFSKAFYLGGTVALVTIILGIILFAPFYNFRFKYRFLEDYEEPVANYLFKIKRRSENWVDSVDGIIGIRLFRVQKHTMNDQIRFDFTSVFDAHSKYTKLSKVRPKYIKKHIDIDKWIENEFKSLNEDAFKKIPKLNKYMEQILLYYLNDYQTKNFDEAQQQKLKNIAVNWETNQFVEKIFKSIHYTGVFKDKKSYEIYINSQKTAVFDSKYIDEKYVYWEDYEYDSNVTKEEPKKLNRRYYNLHLRVKNQEDGISDFILQIIVDKRLVSEDEVVYKFMRNVIK